MKPDIIQQIESEFGIEFKENYSFFAYGKNGFILNIKNEIIALKIDEESDLILKIISFFIKEKNTIEELSFSNEIDLTFAKTFKNLRKLKVEISTSENLQIICELVQLNELSINIIKDIDLSLLKNLKELTHLTIGQHVSNIIFIKKLTKLKWFILHPSNLEDLSPISFLDKLETLWIVGGKVKNIHEVGKLINLKGLVVDTLLIDNPKFIGNLINLETLWLKINGISNISFLKHLKKLKNLDIKSNPINDISIIRELDELEYLRIKRTKVSNISSLRYLNKLKNADLQENEISDITDLLKNKNIKSVNLKGNKKVEIDYPKTVLDAGWESIKQYSIDSRKNIPFKNVKVLLLGNPNIGKSNLLEFFETNRKPIKREITHGVRYKNLKIKDINFHFWDFGGQEYFHATHKLFFSPEALNLILWGENIPRNDNEIENLFFDLNYWLRTV
ncbi:hypothetical protein FIA58_005595 [Flavobacterium jejuense]|uniref:Roc domain-containing protein n=1 Tax=Flavobacterium jejuense TaxID=1544455 RepID=A0ABX0ITH9_9FLAO|nr:leucine-rich repeat domain-containing protein [Flavobacterium jejuense]NHN25149.1 hypothetical protein [Flavobacterium jejuense]